MVDLSDHADLLERFIALPFPRMFMYGEQNATLSYLQTLEARGVDLVEIPFSRALADVLQPGRDVDRDRGLLRPPLPRPVLNWFVLTGPGGVCLRLVRRMPVRAPTSRSAASWRRCGPMAKLIRRWSGAPKTLPGTTATCACSSSQAARSAAVCQGPVRRSPLTSGKANIPPPGRGHVDAGHRAERVHQQVTVAAVLLDRRAGGRTVAERCQRGVLGDERDVGDGARHLPAGGRDDLVGADQPADAPPGHRVDLGDTVHGDEPGEECRFPIRVADGDVCTRAFAEFSIEDGGRVFSSSWRILELYGCSGISLARRPRYRKGPVPLRP